MSTIVKPKIAPEIIHQFQTEIETEKQVIVHCCFPATAFSDLLIRVWPSTFLIDHESDHRSALIHHENISLFPYWTEVPPLKDYWFTLVFSGLPRSCRTFDLQEIIPQEGGFLISDIGRNGTDVYRIKI